MTIITKPLSEKKQEKVLEESMISDTPLPDRNLEEGNIAFLVIKPKTQVVLKLFVAFTALLLLTCAIIGGIYLYRHFVQIRNYRAKCSLPYNNKIDQEGMGKQYIEEEVEIDPDFEYYEIIEVSNVPDADDNGRVHFIHDFSLGLTGIVDVDEERCFVMDLNEALVSPPRTFWEFLQKLTTGYHDDDAEVVLEPMQVVLPPLSNYEDLGFYIRRECKSYLIYKLNKIESGSIYKRDIKEQAVFKVFSGPIPVYYQITFP